MNGIDYLLDTNIILFLVGGRIAQSELPSGNFSISFITELELLSYSYIAAEDEKNI